MVLLTFAALLWALVLLFVLATCAAARRGESLSVSVEDEASATPAPPPPVERAAPAELPLELGRAA